MAGDTHGVNHRASLAGPSRACRVSAEWLLCGKADIEALRPPPNEIIHCGKYPRRCGQKCGGYREALSRLNVGVQRWWRLHLLYRGRATPYGEVYFFSQAARASMKARSPAGPFSIARMARGPFTYTIGMSNPSLSFSS